MFGDALENLTAQDLQISPSITRLPRTHPLLLGSAPTNQQILDATKTFYAQNQDQVDTTTYNTHDVSQNNASFVQTMNSYQSSFQGNQLTPAAQSSTDAAIFGASGSGDGGLFGPTLDKTKASDLFTTISVGISAEAILFVGGLGGLGCSWDIAKREGPKGYGYATAELGLKIAVDVNVQASIFNKLPSQLNDDIFGLTVTIADGLAATFGMFFTNENGTLTKLGYSISIGIGGGAGAAVFGGHLWNFG